MQSSGLEPDLVPYSILLNLHADLADVTAAEAVFGEFARRGLPRSTRAHTALMKVNGMDRGWDRLDGVCTHIPSPSRPDPRLKPNQTPYAQHPTIQSTQHRRTCAPATPRGPRTCCSGWRPRARRRTSTPTPSCCARACSSLLVLLCVGGIGCWGGAWVVVRAQPANHELISHTNTNQSKTATPRSGTCAGRRT